ncbi:MAG: VOC family protein [Candidatus Thermoplasmatota archaeon]|nr:VOC family protein [Candidatus Thermoplasmatota archaeon]
MLASSAPYPILPAPDLEEIRPFYEKQLGLELAEADDQVLRFTLGDGGLLISKNDRTGPAKHSVAGWFVDDIQATVRELRDNGVRFETFGMPAHDGIVELGEDKVAWFQDPAGNVLSVTEVGGTQE